MQVCPPSPVSPGRLTGIIGAALLTVTLVASFAARADDVKPETPAGSKLTAQRSSDFAPDPRYTGKDYDQAQQLEIYGGKTKVVAPRPMIELGQPLYREGALGQHYDVVGKKNLFNPMFEIFGDWRSAVAYNNNGRNKEVGSIATRLNLETDLQFTATERLHALFRPLDQGGVFTHADIFGPNQKKDTLNLNGQVRTLFFEGDAGAIAAGFSDKYKNFDLPFAVGLTPMFFQNGIWANSALLGGAFSIVGKNSPSLGISNMDVTFFAGFDDVTTPAIKVDNILVNHGLSVYGAAAFIEANEGYWEAGLGYLDDQRGLAFNDKSYGSATLAFTKRYFGWLSNSTRGIATFGQQNQANGQKTADGFIVLMENALITDQPLVLVPYLNAFVGVGHPQSLIRNADAGGILFNSGILFETDGLTGYPKLDDTAQNTYGAAIGVNYLFKFDQQIVLEAATVQVRHDNIAFATQQTTALGDQYGFGARYQRNLTSALIFRADVMYAFRQNQDNIAGIRTELRLKF
jgi:hypothetical protein